LSGSVGTVTGSQTTSQTLSGVSSTDTVGFIRNLPSLVIDAFHSTLEEIAVADIVLLVADISEGLDIVVEKLNVSIGELVNIGVESSIILVFNKCDLISQDILDYRIKFFKVLGKDKAIQLKRLLLPDNNSGIFHFLSEERELN
jgi:50S ribosomal subunit-associated GTPase HflX